MVEEMNQSVGERLLQLRNQKGMTQEGLAEYLNVSRQSVSKWELNKTLPDVEKLMQLSELYNVTIDYLVKGEQIQEEETEAEETDMEEEEKKTLLAMEQQENVAESSAGNMIRKNVLLFSMIICGVLCIGAFLFSFRLLARNTFSLEGKQQDVLYVERIYEQYTKAEVLAWNDEQEYYRKKVWLDIPGVKENDYIGYYYENGDSDEVFFNYYTETLILPFVVSIFLLMFTIVCWLGWSGYANSGKKRSHNKEELDIG